jgi:predicted nucleic acid-binding protein
MYLLDTDVLSNVIKKCPSPRLLRKLAETPGEALFTTAVNIAEILYGAARVPHGRQLLSIFNEKIFPCLSILPFDLESAEIHGPLKAGLEKKGLSKSEPDLMIASIALRNNLTVVSGNSRHFAGIPRLRCEDWIGGSNDPR